LARLLLAAAIPLLLIAATDVRSVVAQAQPADELDTMDEQLSMLYQSGKYGVALPLAHRYIAAVRARHDEEHPRLATPAVGSGCCIGPRAASPRQKRCARAPSRSILRRWGPRATPSRAT
jgi:hypothetical protein